MIGFLAGQVRFHLEQAIILDVRGVGYEVFTGQALTPSLSLGTDVELWIYTHVREDQFVLFGFLTPLQRQLFLKLLSVSGVGPRIGYAAATEMSADELVGAIVAGDLVRLRSVNGVGKKVAERIVLELRDKLGDLNLGDLPSGPVGGAGKIRDLTEALTGLGFPDQRVRNVVGWLRQEQPIEELELNALLKVALQKINSR